MEKLLKLGDVVELTARSPTAIYEDIRAGLFPQPVRLGRGVAVRWREGDLSAWLDALPQGVDPAINADAREAGARVRRDRGAS